MSPIFRKKNAGYTLKRHLLVLFALILSCSCTRNYLYVQEERCDVNFLASTKVDTPDPRKNNPPIGQRLLIAWGFPRTLFLKELTLVATVRFWNEEQKQFFHPVERRFGTTAFFFPNKEIITYRVQAVSKQGEVVSAWEHHFWTEFIEIGDRNESNNSSVSSQPIQESVSEIP